MGAVLFPFWKNKDKDNFYELEYILYGKKTDRENLEASVLKLVSVRQGLNMIHILSDGKKRQEAETLAAAITGGGSLLPLTAVVTFFCYGCVGFGRGNGRCEKPFRRWKSTSYEDRL